MIPSFWLHQFAWSFFPSLYLCNISGMPRISVGLTVWNQWAWIFGSIFIFVVLFSLLFYHIFENFLGGFCFLVHCCIFQLRCRFFLISRINSFCDKFKYPIVFSLRSFLRTFYSCLVRNLHISCSPMTHLLLWFFGVLIFISEIIS